MEIFIATTFDLPQLTTLFDLYRQFYGQASDENLCALFLNERMKNNESVIYIAYADNKPAGFVQLYPLFSSVQLKRMWLLNDLFVVEQQRRMGVAKALIDQCKQYAVETDSSGLLLETGKDNSEGNSLYPAQGFTLVENNFYFWKNS